MTTPSLLALPDDAAQALAGFLDARDVENLTATTRAASRDSHFQRLRDGKPATLTLPPTNDDDRCRRLIHAIYQRNPHRLVSLQWVQVIAPWQVELLLEDPAIAECVESVRVRTVDSRDGGIVGQICEKLGGFPRLRKLDVSSTPLDSVDAIGRMTQLRELDLSQTNVRDLSALAPLTELRALVLDKTIAEDLTSIREMAQLELLQVSQDTERTRRTKKSAIEMEPLAFPSLRGLTRLNTLVLDSCLIDSTADLIAIAPTLRRIEFTNVFSRSRTVVDEDAWPTRDVHEDELITQLHKLETILLINQDVLSNTSSMLAKIPSLRAIGHFVDHDLRSLETLANLEEINVCLPEGDHTGFLHNEQEDYTFLLRLPRLKKVTIKQTTELPRHWMPDVEEIHDELVRNHATTLADVLPRLPSLTSLDYKGYIPNDVFLPSLKHLRHLGLRSCAPGFSSFDWIRGFDSLRSLDLTLEASHCDLTALSELSALQTLRLFDTSFVWDAASHGYHAFLTQLRNVKSLQLRGYVEDLAMLRGMTKLETLEIRTSHVPSNAEALRSLVSLQEVDLAYTNLKDFTPLAGLPQLRQVAIPAQTDCRPLVGDDGPPRLLRVLHPQRDCVARCHHREVLTRREEESRNAIYDSDEEKSGVVFGTGAEDY